MADSGKVPAKSWATESNTDSKRGRSQPRRLLWLGIGIAVMTNLIVMSSLLVVFVRLEAKMDHFLDTAQELSSSTKGLSALADRIGLFFSNFELLPESTFDAAANVMSYNYQKIALDIQTVAANIASPGIRPDPTDMRNAQIFQYADLVRSIAQGVTKVAVVPNPNPTPIGNDFLDLTIFNSLAWIDNQTNAAAINNAGVVCKNLLAAVRTAYYADAFSFSYACLGYNGRGDMLWQTCDFSWSQDSMLALVGQDSWWNDICYALTHVSPNPNAGAADTTDTRADL